jgi:hypothetical protein
LLGIFLMLLVLFLVIIKIWRHSVTKESRMDPGTVL